MESTTRLILGFPGTGVESVPSVSSSVWIRLHLNQNEVSNVPKLIEQIVSAYETHLFKFIFVVATIDICKALPKHILDSTYLVVPNKDLRDEYLDRIIKYGYDELIIKKMKSKFGKTITRTERSLTGGNIVRLNSKETVLTLVREFYERDNNEIRSRHNSISRLSRGR